MEEEQQQQQQQPLHIAVLYGIARLDLRYSHERQKLVVNGTTKHPSINAV
jgi:hypothetical protein